MKRLLWNTGLIASLLLCSLLIDLVYRRDAEDVPPTTPTTEQEARPPMDRTAPREDTAAKWLRRL